MERKRKFSKGPIKSKEEREKEREERTKQQQIEHLENWRPKTELGKLVKTGKIKEIDEVLKHKVLEPEIIDSLMKLNSSILNIGQAKGKFGGGKRRAWRQTQRKTNEGNILTFSAMAVVGDKKGHLGVGYGRAKETLPAREKAIRKAKLNITKINLGFENPEDKHSDQYKNDPHTIPYIVKGKCGSIRVKLIPAPRGTGLVVGDEAKKILKLAGIKDVYSVTHGHVRTTLNLIKAYFDALKKTTKLEL